jgi:hypothetical protein
MAEEALNCRGYTVYGARHILITEFLLKKAAFKANFDRSGNLFFLEKSYRFWSDLLGDYIS